ncbi:uncharacterized protein LOC108905457 [Anoplophora glabripennis]|uniref:uncharacterized protein LOC108905457 n=1 Tax=Anoplophora glabripennis TaxID=217634 RepID=UPI0008752860|nr:uncharacterized protein LOC108905457 [Anoplophora glabripennis]
MFCFTIFCKPIVAILIILVASTKSSSTPNRDRGPPNLSGSNDNSGSSFGGNDENSKQGFPNFGGPSSGGNGNSKQSFPNFDKTFDGGEDSKPSFPNFGESTDNSESFSDENKSSGLRFSGSFATPLGPGYFYPNGSTDSTSDEQ